MFTKKQILPLVALATSLAPSLLFAEGSGALSGILKNLANIVVTVIAIVGIIFIIKHAAAVMKGTDGASIGKVVTAVLVTCFLCGMVYTVANIDKIKGAFSAASDKSVTVAGQVAGEALGGGGGGSD